MTQFDQKKISRYNNPDTHPCLKEAELSVKCLEKNNYVNEKCTIFFENYKKCREFWNMVKAERWRRGITPTMPDEKERRLIMAEKEKGNIIYSVKVD